MLPPLSGGTHGRGRKGRGGCQMLNEAVNYFQHGEGSGLGTGGTSRPHPAAGGGAPAGWSPPGRRSGVRVGNQRPGHEPAPSRPAYQGGRRDGRRRRRREGPHVPAATGSVRCAAGVAGPGPCVLDRAAGVLQGPGGATPKAPWDTCPPNERIEGMTEHLTVLASIDVAVDPSAAFQIFTEEIGSWGEPGPTTWNDAPRALGMRFEPGVGGRWVEVYDEDTGEGFEMGRVTVWDPPARLVFGYRDNDLLDPATEVEVRFEPIEGGTRVSLEHRGWERITEDVARRKLQIKEYAWPACLTSFARWTAERKTTERRGTEPLPRLLPVLTYRDVGSAADWLCSAFGFRERMRYPDAEGGISYAELELGDAVILLRPAGDRHGEGDSGR